MKMLIQIPIKMELKNRSKMLTHQLYGPNQMNEDLILISWQGYQKMLDVKLNKIHNLRQTTLDKMQMLINLPKLNLVLQMYLQSLLKFRILSYEERCLEILMKPRQILYQQTFDKRQWRSETSKDKLKNRLKELSMLVWLLFSNKRRKQQVQEEADMVVEEQEIVHVMVHQLRWKESIACLILECLMVGKLEKINSPWMMPSIMQKIILLQRKMNLSIKSKQKLTKNNWPQKII